ncbi:MAG: sortase [Chloroflexi bacterium]|nr:sortase [Chloroflexota bacterium]
MGSRRASRGVRWLANALIAFGLLTLLAALGMVGYDQWRRHQMRQQAALLRQTPAVVASPAPTRSPAPTWTATPNPPTAAPSRLAATPTLQVFGAVSTLTLAPPTDTATPVPPTPTAALPTATPPPFARPVRMVVASIGLDAPVAPVGWRVQLASSGTLTVWETASYAVGHHQGSANPGQGGNVVLSGHHNIEGEVFREVSTIGEEGARLGVGDEVVLYAEDGRAFVYRIREWRRFREAGVSDEERRRNGRFMDPTVFPTLTMITCWPRNNNTHRVVVLADLVGPYEEQ